MTELSTKFHQLMCYCLKQPSRTLICMLAVVELVVLHYIVKKQTNKMYQGRQEAMSESLYIMHVPAEKSCYRS